MQSTPKKPSEINSTIAEGLEQIVMRAMQKDPAQRYQTAGEMIKDLEEFKKNPGIIFEYKYNSTDGTTKYFDRPIPAAEQERNRRRQPVRSEPDDEDEYDDDDYDDDEDEYEERRSPLIPILFAVGTAFVIATVFLVLILVVNNIGGGDDGKLSSILGISDESDISVTESNEFLMPNLVGMTWDEAKAKYSAYMTLVPEQQWSEVTKDQIFDQQYPEGRKIKAGTEVTVKVSKGIRKIEIQDLSNLSASIAKSKLEKDGFKVKNVFDEDDEVAKDFVIRTEPAAHEMADQGSTVVLFISSGPKSTTVSVPRFLTLPYSVALERAKEYYLNAKIEYVDDEEHEKDTVIEQSIDPGTMVDRDTEIILKISTGEIAVKERNLTYNLPNSAEGEFEFRYFVDGVLDDESSVTLDVGLVSSKTMKYVVKGKPGETKNVTIKVTSKLTGRTGTYMEIVVVFPEDGSKATAEDTVYRKIFDELNQPEETEPPIDTSEPETTETTIDTQETEETSSDTEDTNTSQTDNSSEPVESDGQGIAVE